MSNRKYIKSLLLGMSVMMTILIAIQIYITVYVLKHNEMLPRILSCTALILDIIILAVFFVSSRINADVDSMAYTDVTGINNKLAYQNHINRLNNADDTFLVGVIMLSCAYFTSLGIWNLNIVFFIVNIYFSFKTIQNLVYLYCICLLQNNVF